MPAKSRTDLDVSRAGKLTPSGESAVKNGPGRPVRLLAFAALAVVGCGADLWTKQAVFAWRGLPDEQPVWWLWPGYVGIQTALNTGAVFGAFSGWTFLFAVLSFAALGAIALWVYRSSDDWPWGQTVALACICAGILGNLYDRLGLWAPSDMPDTMPRYAVRDWILLCYGRWTWPNFNLADSFLVCATAALVWASLRSTEPTPNTQGTGGSAEPARVSS